MRRYWWTVWIKVAILAVVLLVGFFAVKRYVRGFFEPYVIEDEETAEEEPEVADDSDPVKAIFGKVQDKLGFRFRYEDMIFDYANDFAKDLMEDSVEERSAIEEPHP